MKNVCCSLPGKHFFFLFWSRIHDKSSESATIPQLQHLWCPKQSVTQHSWHTAVTREQPGQTFSTSLQKYTSNVKCQGFQSRCQSQHSTEKVWEELTHCDCKSSHQPVLNMLLEVTISLPFLITLKLQSVAGGLEDADSAPAMLALSRISQYTDVLLWIILPLYLLKNLQIAAAFYQLVHNWVNYTLLDCFPSLPVFLPLSLKLDFYLLFFLVRQLFAKLLSWKRQIGNVVREDRVGLRTLMQWLEAMLCCRRWRQHRVVNASICFPPLEWAHCLVASWVVASPLERQAEEEQKRMYISENRTGNPRRKLKTTDDLANVSWDGREGFKARRMWSPPFIPSFLRELQPELCLREVLDRPHKNKAATGPLCRVLLSGPSALQTLTMRFSYSRVLLIHGQVNVHIAS